MLRNSIYSLELRNLSVFNMKNFPHCTWRLLAILHTLLKILIFSRFYYSTKEIGEYKIKGGTLWCNFKNLIEFFLNKTKNLKINK